MHRIQQNIYVWLSISGVYSMSPTKWTFFIHSILKTCWSIPKESGRGSTEMPRAPAFSKILNLGSTVRAMPGHAVPCLKHGFFSFAQNRLETLLSTKLGWYHQNGKFPQTVFETTTLGIHVTWNFGVRSSLLEGQWTWMAIHLALRIRLNFHFQISNCCWMRGVQKIQLSAIMEYYSPKLAQRTWVGA